MAINRSIATLSAQLRVDGSHLARDTRRATRVLTRQLQLQAQQVNQIYRRALRIGVTTAFLSAAGAATALVTAVNRTRQSIDTLAKDATRLGVLGEQLQVMRLAAEESGVATEALTSSLLKMQDVISDIAHGITSSVGVEQSLTDLNLRVSELIDLDAEQQFLAIAEALSQVGNQADRVRIARDLFGRSGAALMPLFTPDVRERIGESRTFLQRVGATLSQRQLKNVEQMNDQLGRLAVAVGGVIGRFTSELSPAITAIAKQLEDEIGARKFSEFAGDIGVEIKNRLLEEVPEVIKDFGKGFVDQLNQIDIKTLVDASMNALKTFVEIVTNPLIYEGLISFGDLIARTLTTLSRTLDFFVKTLNLALQFLIDTIQAVGAVIHELLVYDRLPSRERLGAVFDELADAGSEFVDSFLKAIEAYVNLPEAAGIIGGQLLAKKATPWLAKLLQGKSPSMEKLAMDRLLAKTSLADSKRYEAHVIAAITHIRDAEIPIERIRSGLISNYPQIRWSSDVGQLEAQLKKALKSARDDQAGFTAQLATLDNHFKLYGRVGGVAGASAVKNLFEGDPRRSKPATTEAVPEKEVVDQPLFADFNASISDLQDTQKITENVADNFGSIRSRINDISDQLADSRGFSAPFENVRATIVGIRDEINSMEFTPESSLLLNELNVKLKEVEDANIREIGYQLDEISDSLQPVNDRFRDLRNALKQIPDEFRTDAIKQKIEIIDDRMRVAAIQASEYWQTFTNVTSSAIDRLIDGGTIKFREFLGWMLREMAKVMARLALFGQNGTGGIFGQFLGNLVGAGIGASFGAGTAGSGVSTIGSTNKLAGSNLGIGNASGKIGWTTIGSSGGFRAMGGPVRAGTPYVVGERGAELMVPNQNGYVVPNHDISKMGGVVVHQTFNQGVDQEGLALQLARTKQETMQAVFDAIRQGGGAYDVVRMAR